MTDYSSLTPPLPGQAGAGGHDATAVMGRRITAWILDLVVFIGIALATFAALAEYTEIPASFFGDACSELTDTAAADDAIDDIGACFVVNDRAYTTTEAEGAVQSLVSLGYLAVFVVMQGATGGSPGKLLTGLRVVKEDGTKAGVGRSAVRTVLWVVDGAPWFAPLVGFIVGLTSTGHRRVGDMVAKTYVVARRDQGAPVSTGAATAPPSGQQSWGAPPPMGSGNWAPPTTSAPPPMPTPEPPAPTPGPTAGPAPAPAAPSPPPLPSSQDDAAPWDQPISDPAAGPPPHAAAPTPDAASPTAEADSPTVEAATRADEAPPEIGADPRWYHGPEADPAESGSGSWDADDIGREPPSTEPIIDEPDTSEPETWTPTDPATEWAPPSTPTEDIEHADNASPTAGPGGFVAPGADAPTSPAAGQTPMSQPAAPQAPPPQWDQARNTYIQWDPNQQMWLQWDTVANRWKPIDT